MNVQGFYTFKDPDELIWTVSYRADENGYKAQVEPPTKEDDEDDFIDIRISERVLASLLG